MFIFLLAFFAFLLFISLIGFFFGSHFLGVNSAELGSVVAKAFGQALQWAGVETVIVDNDKKAHSKTATNAWEKSEIKVWPGAGKVKDRTLIADFTGESADKLGGFPVNSPDCTVQDQSVNTLGRML